MARMTKLSKNYDMSLPCVRSGSNEREIVLSNNYDMSWQGESQDIALDRR